MFREPEAVGSKAAGEVDPSVPARSSIRRQRSVRHPARNHRDRQPSSRSRSHRHYERLLQEIRDPQRARALAARSHVERALQVEASANQAHAEASRRRRLDSGRPTLRDALSYERSNRSPSMQSNESYTLSMIRPPMPPRASSTNPSRRPRRGSFSRRDSARVSSHQSGAGRIQTPPPAYIPSPPYTSGDRSDRSSPDTLHTVSGTASLTPRFAPAQSLPDINSVIGQAHPHHHQSNPTSLTTDDLTTNDLPPLRGVNRRHTARPNRQPTAGTFVYDTVDGLGDRWRSVSPDDDPWDTLLSTLPLDERLPSSTSSSFRSGEDLTYYGDIADAAESATDTMELFPVNCENSESDFSTTDDDLELFRGVARGNGSHIIEDYDGYPHAIAPRLTLAQDAQLSQQRRDNTRQGITRIPLPDRFRNRGRFSWERL
ncbi:MAG: hypothetical protein Q9170_003345 [Blastenia crenularia]